MLSQGRKNNEFKDCTDRHTDVHVRPQSLCLINMATSPTPNILAPVHFPRNPTGLVRTLVPLPTSLREIASFRRSVELPKGRQLSGSMTGECRRQRVFISTSSPGGVGRARLRLVWRQCGVIRTLCPLPPRLLLGSTHTHTHTLLSSPQRALGCQIGLCVSCGLKGRSHESCVDFFFCLGVSDLIRATVYTLLD